MNQKHFEDVDLDNLGYGGLGGAAVEDHNKAKAKPTRDGVQIKLSCDNCGAPNKLTVDWKEVIIISTGAIPPGWKYESGYIRPEVGCASCRRLVSPGITPDEALRWVKAGISAQFVNAQQAEQIAQQAKRGVR